MKIKVEVLNYDSQWVNYCNAVTRCQADNAVYDLQHTHNFKPFQIRCTEK